MIILDSTTEKIQVITGSAGDIEVQASSADVTTGPTVTVAGAALASITTATTTDVVAAPAASTQRKLKYLGIFNNHASVSNAITVQETDGTNIVTLFKGTLAPAECMIYVDGGDGWKIYDATGAIKVVATAPGRLLKRSILTSGTTVALLAGTNAVIARLRAGGGGGGGGSSVAVSAAVGGGGSQGGYAEILKSGALGGVTLTYGIGGAGAAGANTGGTGGTGGNTTITILGTLVTANGGIGGVGQVGNTTVLQTLGGAPPAISTNGDMNSSGEPGSWSHRLSGTAGISGNGGGSGGGVSKSAQGAGNNAVGNDGAGGGGCCVLNGGAAAVGGTGAVGSIILEEYS